ncbi:hypothetical protein KPZU09_36870 [Klebsiella pneumoniae]|uniref:Uncharacterized protein n=1 Tax=Klebsiella pneumoniae TaxID=573 RepID=A0A919LP06_KLEPN|nr:hypothetical protein KPZU09_36870 [Klebsiella pneumoniae]
MALACLLYYVWFFLQFGISGEQLTTGLQQIGRYGADVRLARLLELAVRLLLYANRRHRPSSSPGR